MLRLVRCRCYQRPRTRGPAAFPCRISPPTGPTAAEARSPNLSHPCGDRIRAAVGRPSAALIRRTPPVAIGKPQTLGRGRC
jgi:hypothetical protein